MKNTDQAAEEYFERVLIHSEELRALTPSQKNQVLTCLFAYGELLQLPQQEQPAPVEEIKAFDLWLFENGFIQEHRNQSNFFLKTYYKFLESRKSNTASVKDSQVVSEMNERVTKLLFEDDYKKWRQKEGWRYHNDGQYWYKLDYPSQWPTPHVKYSSELESEFLNQYESAYVNEWLQSNPHPQQVVSESEIEEAANHYAKLIEDWEGYEVAVRSYKAGAKWYQSRLKDKGQINDSQEQINNLANIARNAKNGRP